jgi:anti-sigma B factor antagonist
VQVTTWNLTIAREVEGGVAIVVVAGRLGTSSSGRLLDALAETIAAGHRRIVMDLGGVDYASSAGLMALDAAAGRVHETGGTLVLCALGEPVRLVLDVSGLFQEFVIETTRAEAVARLR